MSDRKLNPKKILLDRDGDGIVDRVDLQLHLFPSCSNPKILSTVMDLSACLSFGTMGLDLPLAKAEEERDSSFHHHLYIGLNQELEAFYSSRRPNDYFLVGEDEFSLEKLIREFSLSFISSDAKVVKRGRIREDHKREGFNLLHLFSNQGFFCNSSESILPFLFPYKLSLFSHLDLATAVASANFAARLGLETHHLSLPLTFPFGESPRSQNHFIHIGEKEDLHEHFPLGLKNILGGDWKSGIFLLSSKERIPDVLICGDKNGLKEILGYLSCIPAGSTGAKDPIFEKGRIVSERLGHFIFKKPDRLAPAARKIVRDYLIPDERGEIIRLLEKEMRSRPLKLKAVKIQVLMARPEEVRKKVEQDIRGLLKRRGYRGDQIDVIVLNAHKPGLSWMREVVLKEIAGKKVEKIEIAFKEFKEKGLEEPIRWLQEIYPIDEIFAASLAIPRKKIELKKDLRINETYRVRAWRKRKIVYENFFSPKWVGQPYLHVFPRLGKIHPCTGWVRMEVDGQDLVDQRVKTGMERIWEIYQKEILSFVAKEGNQVLRKKELTAPDPIFEELRFDIYFDHPMEPLGIDEERLSPLEALHEDLYFVTLDFFSRWAKSRGLKNLSPGRILPVIHPHFHQRNGKMRFTLVHPSPSAFLASQREVETGMVLNGIFLIGSKIGYDLSIKGERRDREWLRRRIRNHESLKDADFKIEQIPQKDRPGREGFRLIAWSADPLKSWGPFTRKKKLKPREISSLVIPGERPIGYAEGVRITKSLEALPGAQVIEEGRSSGGLPILSVENTYPSASAVISHAKRILFRPTFFINCRHHANEVSSTNAGLTLSYLLASRPRFRQFLKKTNVVMNPMENVDGMVILEEILRLTPTDKLHAGRYNQAGQEYYSEYFRPETACGEAKVKPAIWERWLPDICVDDHGFPSHEWEEPFSGYAPFRFREWWIPRALFYIYLPFLEEKRSSPRRINSEFVRDWIAKAISKEKEIRERNQAFSRRYSKYRGKWVERITQTNEVLLCLPVQKRFRRTNYSYRRPRLTTCDFITEVADETAQGRFLGSCVRAHLLTNLSILKLLCSLNNSVKKIYRREGKQHHFLWYRERPLNFRAGRKEG